MIRLAKPSIGKQSLKEIAKVLNSGYLTQGVKVSEFEKAVSKYLKVRYALAVSSGTAALHLALLALDVGKGDEVIVPDFTYPATANVVEMVGAKPVCVDIELDTFNISIKEIELKITKKTKAILPVHLFGQPANMDKIMQYARRHKLFIIEDAAGALGAEYKKKKCGTIGNIGCLSFHPRKIITTGEGGMVLTNDRTVAEQVMLLRNHGMKKGHLAGSFPRAGLNYKMTEIQAILGIEQIRRIRKIILERRKLAKLYDKLLQNCSFVETPIEKNYARHTYQAYAIKVKKSRDRNRFIKYLQKNDIEATIGTYALHNTQHYRKKFFLRKKGFKNTEEVEARTLTLPLYYGLKEKEVRKIANIIKKFK